MRWMDLREAIQGIESRGILFTTKAIHILPYAILPSPIISHHIHYYPVLYYLLLSYFILSYLCLMPFYPILPCPIPFYPTPFHLTQFHPFCVGSENDWHFLQSHRIFWLPSYQLFSFRFFVSPMKLKMGSTSPDLYHPTLRQKPLLNSSWTKIVESHICFTSSN